MSITIQASELRGHSFVSESALDSTVTSYSYSLSQYLREVQNFSVGVVVNSFSIEDTVNEEDLERRAVGALTALVKQNPLSLPLLITAIEDGHIDGLTYGDYLQSSDTTAPRCIVGWAMVATEAVSTYDSHLRVTDRGYLEKYVFSIRSGETHLTNHRLAVLYTALNNMYVDNITVTDVDVATVEDSIPAEFTQASEQLSQNVAVFLNSMEERMEDTADRQLARSLSYA